MTQWVRKSIWDSPFTFQSYLMFMVIISPKAIDQSLICRYFFVIYWSILVFVDTKQFFVQHHIVFVDTRSLLCNVKFFFRHKIVFCALPIFYFGHCVEYFYCHVATKIESRAKRKETIFIRHKFFLYSIFKLQTGSMLIFFLVVFKTKTTLWKTSVKGSDFCKIAGFFAAISSKWTL